MEWNVSLLVLPFKSMKNEPFEKGTSNDEERRAILERVILLVA